MLAADEKRSLLEQHRRTNAERQRESKGGEPAARGLRQCELAGGQTENEHTARADEREVKAHAEAGDLAVAKMGKQQDIGRIGKAGGKRDGRAERIDAAAIEEQKNAGSAEQRA